MFSQVRHEHCSMWTPPVQHLCLLMTKTGISQPHASKEWRRIEQLTPTPHPQSAQVFLTAFHPQKQERCQKPEYHPRRLDPTVILYLCNVPKPGPYHHKTPRCPASRGWVWVTFSFETLWEKGQVPSSRLHVPLRNLKTRKIWLKSCVAM